MATLHNKNGIIWVKRDSDRWLPLRKDNKIWVKQSNNEWKEVKAVFRKKSESVWQQIYPAPEGNLTSTPSTLDFGNVYQNLKHSTNGIEFTLTNSGNNDLSITRIDLSTDDPADPSYGYYKSILTGWTGKITLVADATKTYRLNVEGILLSSTAIQGYVKVVGTSVLEGVTTELTLNIPVSVKIIPQFADIQVQDPATNVERSTLSFSSLAGDELESKQLKIVNTGNGSDLEIVSITPSNDYVSYSTGDQSLQFLNSLILTVSAAAKSQPGTYTSTITIQSRSVNDNTSLEDTVITVTHTVAEKKSYIEFIGPNLSNPSQIVASYNSTDTQGPELQITIKCKSTSTKPLIIQEVNDGSVTTITNKTEFNNLTLDKNQTAIIKIRGKQLNSNQTDTIYVKNNSDNNPILAIQIQYNITLIKAQLISNPVSINATDWQIVTINNIEKPQLKNSIRLTNDKLNTQGRNIEVKDFRYTSSSAITAELINAPGFPFTLTPTEFLDVKINLASNYSGTTNGQFIFVCDDDDKELKIDYIFTNIIIPPTQIGPFISVTPTSATVNFKERDAKKSIEWNVSNPTDRLPSDRIVFKYLGVTDIRSSDGFVAASLTDFTVAPDAAQALQLYLDYGGHSPGTYTSTITATSNAVSRISNSISVTVNVAALTPPKMIITIVSTSTDTTILAKERDQKILYNVINQGAAAFIRNIKIKNDSTAEKDLVITKIESASTKINPNITISEAQPLVIKRNEEVTVPITIDYNTLNYTSRYDDIIRIYNNVPGAAPYFSLTAQTVINRVIGEVSVVELNSNTVVSSLAAGVTISPAETKTYQLRIRNIGNGVLNCTSINGPGTYFTVSPTTATVQPNAYVTLTLTIKTSFFNDTGTFQDVLTIASNGIVQSVSVPIAITVGHGAGSRSFSITSHADYTLPYTLQNFTYHIVAGGGGGGYSETWQNGVAGGGGGGGGYLKGLLDKVPKAAILSTTIGAKGAGSDSGNKHRDGYDGGKSQLIIKSSSNATLYTLAAAGGTGGKGSKYGPQDGGICPTDAKRNGKPGTGANSDQATCNGGDGGAGVSLPNGGTYGKGGEGAYLEDYPNSSTREKNGAAGTDGYIYVEWTNWP